MRPLCRTTTVAVLSLTMIIGQQIFDDQSCSCVERPDDPGAAACLFGQVTLVSNLRLICRSFGMRDLVTDEASSAGRHSGCFLSGLGAFDRFPSALTERRCRMLASARRGVGVCASAASAAGRWRQRRCAQNKAASYDQAIPPNLCRLRDSVRGTMEERIRWWKTHPWPALSPGSPNRLRHRPGCGWRRALTRPDQSATPGHP